MRDASHYLPTIIVVGRHKLHEDACQWADINCPLHVHAVGSISHTIVLFSISHTISHPLSGHPLSPLSHPIFLFSSVSHILYRTHYLATHCRHYLTQYFYYLSSPTISILYPTICPLYHNHYLEQQE